MLYPGLERLIQKGKAQYHSFAVGASGVGTIPCPNGSFIILTDFDYFSFIDVPPIVEGLPAQGLVDLAYIPSGLVLGDFMFPPYANLLGITVDFDSAVITQANIQAGLNADINFAGWTVSVISAGPGFLSITFTTSSPGFVFNGIVPDFVSLAVGLIVGKVDFFGGTEDSVLSFQDLLDRSTHQVEFKTTKSRNHYIIRDDVILTAVDTGGGPIPVLSAVGHFHRDMYFPHVEDVQINIVCVPAVSKWSTNYTQLPAKSQEFNAPSGYGQGAVGFPAVREVIFDALGNTQQYFPLTRLRDNLPEISGQQRDQFKVDVNNLNKLNDPTQAGKYDTFAFNDRTYPILNVGYVLVNMNYNDFVSSSNG